MKRLKIRKPDRHGKIKKLQAVNDYYTYMGGSDQNDMIIGNYSCVKKTIKCTKKVAFHFFVMHSVLQFITLSCQQNYLYLTC